MLIVKYSYNVEMYTMGSKNSVIPSLKDKCCYPIGIHPLEFFSGVDKNSNFK